MVPRELQARLEAGGAHHIIGGFGSAALEGEGGAESELAVKATLLPLQLIYLKKPQVPGFQEGPC